MNIQVLVGVLALGALCVGMMWWVERAAEQRYRRIENPRDCTATVVRRSYSHTQKRPVFDVGYVDEHGVSHELQSVAMVGHVTAGDQVAVRYPSHDPSKGVVAPRHMRSSRTQMVVAALVFVALGVGLALAK